MRKLNDVSAIFLQLGFGFALSLSLLSCSQKSAENTQASGRSAKSDKLPTSEQAQALETANKQEQAASAIKDDDQAVAEAKYDASSLTVFNVRVVKLRQKLNVGLSLSYDPDGRADYIDYTICPLENTGKSCPAGAVCTQGGECFEGVTVYNRVQIPPIFAGNVLYKVRACVDRSHALTEETCGAWEEKKFDSQMLDVRTASIYGQALNIKKALGKLVAEDYRQALEDFTKEAAACDNLNADVKKVLDSKIRVVEQFLRAPASWFLQAGEDLFDGVFGDGTTGEITEAVGKFGSQVSRQLANACVELGEATSDKVCEGLKFLGHFAKGFIVFMSPVAPVGTLSSAIHDIYYGSFLGKGDKLVPKGCHAEENLQRSVQAIQAAMQAKLQRLQMLKQELQAKGESPDLPAEGEGSDGL